MDARAKATLLVNHRINAAPVVDKDGKLVGIISEGDLLRRVEIGLSLCLPAYISDTTAA